MPDSPKCDGSGKLDARKEYHDQLYVVQDCPGCGACRRVVLGGGGGLVDVTPTTVSVERLTDLDNLPMSPLRASKIRQAETEPGDLDRPSDERLKKLCGIIVPGEGTIETSRLSNEVTSMARELLDLRAQVGQLEVKNRELLNARIDFVWVSQDDLAAKAEALTNAKLLGMASEQRAEAAEVELDEWKKKACYERNRAIKAKGDRDAAEAKMGEMESWPKTDDEIDAFIEKHGPFPPADPKLLAEVMRRVRTPVELVGDWTNGVLWAVIHDDGSPDGLYHDEAEAKDKADDGLIIFPIRVNPTGGK